MSTHRMTTRRGANHGLHLVLTILTMGLWAPVWLIMAMVGRRETTTFPDISHVFGPMDKGSAWYQVQGETWDYNPYSGQWVRR